MILIILNMIRIVVSLYLPQLFDLSSWNLLRQLLLFFWTRPVIYWLLIDHRDFDTLELVPAYGMRLRMSFSKNRECWNDIKLELLALSQSILFQECSSLSGWSGCPNDPVVFAPRTKFLHLELMLCRSAVVALLTCARSTNHPHGREFESFVLRPEHQAEESAARSVSSVLVSARQTTLAG